MMPKVFASTGCLGGSEPVLDRVQRYLDAGIDCIELGAGTYAGVSELAALRSIDGQLLVHNYFPPPSKPFVMNLASADPEIRSRSLDLATNALRFSHEVGAPFYSVHAGFITDPVDFEGSTFIFPAPSEPDAAARATDRFIQTVNTLLDETSSLEPGLLIENNVCYPEHVGKLLMQAPQEFDPVFEAIANPRLGILLDTGHLNVSAHTLDFDRMDFISRHEERIRALHFHDNDGLADQHRHPERDSWTYDLLSNLEPFGPVVVLEARFESISDLAVAYSQTIRTLE